MAGHIIALETASFTFMVPLGLALAITVRVGHAMGRGDPRAARIAGTVGIGLSFSFMGLAAVGMLLFPELIAACFTDRIEVQQLAVSLLAMAAIFQLSDGLQVSGNGALRGLKDTTVPMLITLTAYWLVGFPLALLFGVTLKGGPIGLWWGLIAGLTSAAVLLNARFFWRMHRLIQAAERGQERLALRPELAGAHVVALQAEVNGR